MRKTVSFFLIIAVFLVIPFRSFAGGGAFLIMDGNTYAVLEAENGDQRLPMASTTKIITALVVLENVPLSSKVKIPAEAAGVEGSSLYIKAGETYTVEELLYGLMLRSANDCAVALASYVGGGDADVFITKMNERAAQIGLKDTHFANPNGLSAPEHYTTARELALMMGEAMKNAEFRKIAATKRHTIKGQTVVNHNKLLSLYPDCIGGKTGYTMEAGRCLVTMAERDGVSLIAVTLGRRDDWNIHADAYEKWFPEAKVVTLAEKGGFSVELPVAGGMPVRAVNYNAVSVPLFQYDGTVESRVVSPQFLYGNKPAGAVVGTLEFWYKKSKIGESPLVLESPIRLPVKKELFITRIFRFFRRLFLKNH